MGLLTTGTVVKISLELLLGFSMKLFCDHGRVHYSDFVNDFLFWLPGMESVDNDGLTRSIIAARTEPVEVEVEVEVEDAHTPTRAAA